MEKDALEYIKQSHAQAERDAQQMKAALVNADRAAFGRLLREYLLVRFIMSSSDAGDEQRIEELARKSLVLQKGGKGCSGERQGYHLPEQQHCGG